MSRKQEDKANPEVIAELEKHREKLRDVYCEIPVNKIYLNSRSSIDFSYKDEKGKIRQTSLDPMTAAVIVASVVPKSAVLFKGGHGGGKTSMIEEVSHRLFDVPRDEIVAAMIRGNDDQNVNTLLAAYNIGKLLAKGDEEVRWRKFVTSPIKIADEINRFPPTAQNALFEIFNKGRVEFADNVYEVDYFELFATENPNDVGTYPMSRPFLDRFGFCVPAPQLPSAEDLMALSGRRDDKIYGMGEAKNQLTIADAKKLEKIVSDNVLMNADSLLYSVYLAQSLETCIRGDFGDKTHCELRIPERCKGCPYDTSEALCKRTNDGFSGRAFLDLQRWSKAFSHFLGAFEDPQKPEVQQSIVQAVAPYVLYHRVSPNDAFFTRDPYFGRTLQYLTKLADDAARSYATVKEALVEIPLILRGDISPSKAKLESVKKDIVVQEHFLPIVRAAGLPEFRAIYRQIEESESLSPRDIIALERTMTFGSTLPPRARAFLRSKAQYKTEGGEAI